MRGAIGAERLLPYWNANPMKFVTMRITSSALLGVAAAVIAGFAVQAQTAAPAVPPAKAQAPAKDAPAESKTDKKADVVAAAQPAPASTIDASDEEDDDKDADGIVATVNDESVSDYEVRQRMALFIATTNANPSAEDRKRIRKQIIAQLQDEKLELQEAQKKHITVSPTEVDKRIDNLAEENHISVAQLRATLEVAGATMESLKAQMTASLAWQKTVQSEYMDRVNVTQADIDAELARIKDGANKVHYLVSEIVLPVDNPAKEEETRKAAEDVAKQLAQGATFQGLAHQMSQSPSAAAGGDMGWVRPGQLAPELDAMIAKMPVGSISPPVRAAGGWYVLALRGRQEPAGTDVTPINPNPDYPAGSLPLARLLLPMGPSPAKAEVEQAMKIGAQIKGHVVSCQGMDKVAEQIKGSVYNDLGVTRLADMSKQIQDAMANTQPGETANPFQDEAGIEIIGRCDKRPEIRQAFQIPSRDDVEQQLFEEQISALARRYKRDLKRDADIQIR